jgi:hypothetical protein
MLMKVCFIKAIQGKWWLNWTAIIINNCRNYKDVCSFLAQITRWSSWGQSLYEIDNKSSFSSSLLVDELRLWLASESVAFTKESSEAVKVMSGPPKSEANSERLSPRVSGTVKKTKMSPVTRMMA